MVKGLPALFGYRNISRECGVFIRIRGGHLMRKLQTQSDISLLAFRYLHNKEDAEEVAQDVLYKVYRKVDAFRGDAALSSWIYRITFNAAMSRLREFKQNLPLAPEKAADEETGQTLNREVVDWSPL